MSLRRVLLSFAVTFACALAVFTLPRFVWNSVRAVSAQTPAQGGATPATAAPAGQESATPATQIAAAIATTIHASAATPTRPDPPVADQSRTGLRACHAASRTPAPITGPAAKFSRTPTRVRTGAPALGAHTEEILRELGIDDSELPRLREAKIV
jgi:crotonobetainyl-CoA:carnitine CoA-transferase CaiB-like acyl-CoA transferase